MFLIKTNIWNGKTYQYDEDKYDIFTDMFDEKLHNNDITPLIINPYVCGYCQTIFSSRTKLFYHLGYMGININNE